MVDTVVDSTDDVSLYEYIISGLEPTSSFKFRVISNREDNSKPVAGRPSPPSEAVIPTCYGKTWCFGDGLKLLDRYMCRFNP